ncbi:MAG TPA: hypothetical protein VGB62_08305 [Allosphingosinicella sp.]|jgi:hypothetical protein
MSSSPHSALRAVRGWAKTRERLDPELDRAAHAILPHAARLIAAIGGGLVTIAGKPGGGAVCLHPWTRALEPGEELAGASLANQEAKQAALAIRDEGKALLAAVAKRWPPNAVPPVVGVVTDGTGLAISGAHPSALNAAWLSDHLTGAAPVFEIVPFYNYGLWRLITAPKPGAKLT